MPIILITFQYRNTRCCNWAVPNNSNFFHEASTYGKYASSELSLGEEKRNHMHRFIGRLRPRCEIQITQLEEVELPCGSRRSTQPAFPYLPEFLGWRPTNRVWNPQKSVWSYDQAFCHLLSQLRQFRPSSWSGSTDRKHCVEETAFLLCFQLNRASRPRRQTTWPEAERVGASSPFSPIPLSCPSSERQSQPSPQPALNCYRSCKASADSPTADWDAVPGVGS